VLDELATCFPPLLRGVSSEQRRVVELIDLGSLTPTRAAGVEGITVPGLKSRVQRADTRRLRRPDRLPAATGLRLRLGGHATRRCSARAGVAGHRARRRTGDQSRPGQPQVPVLGW
jgi:hypothetical protein